MYKLRKRLEVAASHKLNLSYESKCQNLHGHNWIIDVYLQGRELNQDGMLMDFTHIKKKIQDKMDHQNLCAVFPNMNTTAENLSKWICEELGLMCYRVDVQESENNIATYERDYVDYL